MTTRRLGPGDEAGLEAFLAGHADSSMFLRANARAAGLVDRGAPLEGTYAAAFDAGGAIVAVAAHCWNGLVLLQAPARLAEVVALATALSGRRVAGLIGPHAQVVAARAALGLAEATATMDSREALFALALADLQVPATLARGEVVCRPARAGDPRELDLLTAWRVDYVAEALGMPRGADTSAQARADVARLAGAGDAFVLEQAGAPVAFSAFNARLPDVVQIGGVWTPPALRGRGFARAVVAGSLVAARVAGVARSILFTGDDHVAAQRAYLALGYRVVGDYGITLFA